VADGGTLFLDEIGELPLAMQAKLLRVLESGEVQRVGSVEPRRVDVVVLAATNRNLQEAVAAGRFRSDLYYRLNVVELRVPSLRERREDIPYLTAAFVRECSARLGKHLIGLTPAAEKALILAPLNGNVRELRNVVERACILSDSDLITEREFAGNVSQPAPLDAPREGSLSAVERDHIAGVLLRAGGNKAKAARLLGLDRRSLYRRLELYSIGTVPRRIR